MYCSYFTGSAKTRRTPRFTSKNLTGMLNKNRYFDFLQEVHVDIRGLGSHQAQVGIFLTNLYIFLDAHISL
jgi:hypothetical protein